MYAERDTDACRTNTGRHGMPNDGGGSSNFRLLGPVLSGVGVLTFENRFSMVVIFDAMPNPRLSF